MQNFYSILEVSPNATKDQLKSQYRKLVRECHPDQYLEAHVKLHYEEKLKEINQAYTNVLQSHLSSNSKVVSNKTPLSHISILMCLASLFVLTCIVVALALPTTVFSGIPEIRKQKQMAEMASDSQRQPVILQDSLYQNESMPKVIVQTPKLGTTIHPIAPLHLKAMSKTKK